MCGRDVLIWAGPYGNEKVLGHDDYGNEIANWQEYFYEDDDFGRMSEDTFKDLVKNYKTPCDVIAEQDTEDDWNGEIIKKGERYLVVDELKMKVFNDTTFEEVCSHVTKFDMCDYEDCYGKEW